MKKKYLLLLPLFLALASCSGTTPANEYHYKNPEEPQMDIGPEVESAVNLDGLGNDSFYDNENIYRIDNAEEEDSYAEVKFGFAEKGFLAYAYVHEKAIFENTNVLIYQQDSFELYINPTDYKDELRSSCSQFRISPRHRSETWIGMKSPIVDYTWSRQYIEFRFATHIDGKIITTEREMYDDTYYQSQGIGYEFYIPYTSLGLDYNPQGLDILPAMVTAHSIFEDDRVWSPYNGVGIDDLKNYITVGNRVYKDQGDNVFDTDRTSSGFVLEHQLDESYPYVTNYGIHDQYGYFNAFGDVYHASARIHLFHELENDPSPKVGIGNKSAYGTSVMLLDPRPNKDCYEALLVNRVGENNWEWSAFPPSWKGEKTYEHPIVVDAVRYHDKLYFYMNGERVFSENTDKLGNINSYPILLTMNYHARFDQCFVTTNEAEVLEFIGGIGPYLSVDSTDGYSYNDGVYTQSGIKDQYGIFKKSGTSYTLSVDIVIGEVLEGDLYPKVGIGEMTSSGRLNAYLLDPRPSKDCYETVHTYKESSSDGFQWKEVFWQGEKNFDRTIIMKIVRSGNTTDVYMDNILAFTCTNNFNNDASRPIFLTMNHSATFSNVSYSE